MSKKNYFILITAILLTLFQVTRSQDFARNSIKSGFGIGVSMGNNTDGFGFMYSFGYQREIWRDRLRLNPNFSIGHYSSKFVLDARDQFFNSINLETNVYFDLIKINSFSLVAGAGGVINNSRGLMGTGGRSESNDTEQQSSEYVSDFHFGGYFGGGFRINKPDKRIAINVLLFNFHVGNNYFMEGHAKIEMDIKL